MAKEKEKKVSPREWMKRINRAKKFRDQVKDKQHWDQIQEEYEGEYKIAGTTIKYPPINIVFGYVDTGISKLYFKDPYISVNAKSGKYVNRAPLVEKVINYLVRELGIKKEIEKVLRDTLMVGHGWLKFGYSGEIQEEEQKEGQTSEEINEFIKDGEAFVIHVPYEDILFDVTLCKDPPYDCRWIAHRIVKPLEAFKNSKLYKNTDGLESNISALDMSGQKIEKELHDSDLEMFEAWEIHDKDSDQVLVVADKTDKFLREDDNGLEMEGLPFSMLKFNPIPKKPYPLSDIFIIEPQILERIKLRGAQLNHIKRWSRQLSIEKGSMSKEEMEKFSMGVDGGVTQREKGTAPPSPIQYAPLQDEIFVLDDLIQKDMDTEIGQNDVDRGGQARTKTKTKYELQEQQQGIAGRTAKRQDKLEDFLEEVFRKVLQLVKQFQTTEKYVAITGMTPQEMMEKLGVGIDMMAPGGVMFDKDDIQGEFDVEVKAGSTLPMNKANKIRVLEGLLEVLPKTGLQPGNPVSTAVIKDLLRELDLQDAIKAMEDMENKAAGPQAGPGVPPPGPVAPPPVGPPAPLPPGPGASLPPRPM